MNYASVREGTNYDEILIGTYVVMLSRPDSRELVLFHSKSYEVAPDGDLIVTSQGGNLMQIDAGVWLGIGTLERTEGEPWIAVECTARRMPAK